MSFEDSISKGVLAIPWCSACSMHSWPPGDSCRRCSNAVKLRRSSGRGRIVEYSADGAGYYCLAEFEESVRIMCRITGIETPECGDGVILEKCGRDDDGCFFNVRLEQVMSK